MSVKKEYSRKEIERILKSEAKIPKAVDQGMERAYREIGIEEEERNMKYTKKHRAWVAVAVAATMVMGMSVVVVAANKFLNANLVDKPHDKVGYQFEVDETKEAHAIKVETTYMPEGYALANENDPESGKWKNDSTGGHISVIPYNAADLDRLERLGQGLSKDFSTDEHLKDMEISGMKTDVFVSDNFYTDSENAEKDLYLFNEENGYMVHIWSESTLDPEELIKIAEGLKVTVLDTVVPYDTEEEIAAQKESNESSQKAEKEINQAGVPKESIYKMGQEIENPLESMKEYRGDIGYTVEDIQIKDAISLDEYPAEYFVDYENKIAPWLNSDGTLKAHDRYWYPGMGMTVDEGTLQTGIASKFVVVKMKAVNHGDAVISEDGGGVPIAPDLTTLEPREDGNYSYSSSYFYPANENYNLQWGSVNGSNFPVYFDKMYYTEGIAHLKTALFRPLDAGEELEYTLIYIMDEDRLDQSYLQFFSEIGSAYEKVISPYVKISE